MNTRDYYQDFFLKFFLARKWTKKKKSHCFNFTLSFHNPPKLNDKDTDHVWLCSWSRPRRRVWKRYTGEICGTTIDFDDQPFLWIWASCPSWFNLIPIKMEIWSFAPWWVILFLAQVLSELMHWTHVFVSVSPPHESVTNFCFIWYGGEKKKKGAERAACREGVRRLRRCERNNGDARGGGKRWPRFYGLWCLYFRFHTDSSGTENIDRPPFLLYIYIYSVVHFLKKSLSFLFSGHVGILKILLSHGAPNDK